MSARDAFAENFRRLLREIPAGTPLPEWQYLYRQAIFSMGMQILELFPEDAVGPDPSNHSSAGGESRPVKQNPVIESQGPGGHPSTPCSQFVDIAAFVLCMPSGGN